MDKQKQMIEEMAKVVRKYYSGFSEYKVAEEIYRILIPEGAVVLTREEYSDYLVMKDAHQNAIERCDKLQADNERLYKSIGKFKGIVRKETAEKFAERLKAKLSEWLDDNEDLNFKIDKGIAIIELIGVESLEGEVIVESLIDEICKEIIGEEK